MIGQDDAPPPHDVSPPSNDGNPFSPVLECEFMPSPHALAEALEQAMREPSFEEERDYYFEASSEDLESLCSSSCSKCNVIKTPYPIISCTPDFPVLETHNEFTSHDTLSTKTLGESFGSTLALYRGEATSKKTSVWRKIARVFDIRDPSTWPKQAKSIRHTPTGTIRQPPLRVSHVQLHGDPAEWNEWEWGVTHDEGSAQQQQDNNPPNDASSTAQQNTNRVPRSQRPQLRREERPPLIMRQGVPVRVDNCQRNPNIVPTASRLPSRREERPIRGRGLTWMDHYRRRRTAWINNYRRQRSVPQPSENVPLPDPQQAIPAGETRSRPEHRPRLASLGLSAQRLGCRSIGIDPLLPAQGDDEAYLLPGGSYVTEAWVDPSINEEETGNTQMSRVRRRTRKFFRDMRQIFRH